MRILTCQRVGRRIVSATIWLGLATLVALASPGRAETLACRTLRGPCQFFDTLNVLLGPDQAAPILVANFGLVTADGAATLHYTCEAALGGLAARARIGPQGRILLAGDQGIAIYAPACGGSVAFGTVMDRPVLSLLFGSGSDVWALGAVPRALHHSSDGGLHFTAGFQFAADDDVLELGGSPARPATLYAVGDGLTDRQLLITRSDDSGATFAVVPHDPDPTRFPSGLPLELLGVSPADAETLFVAMRADDGHDNVWRSHDGGRSWQMVLALPTTEILGAFTFGVDGQHLYVGGHAPLAVAGTLPAHLYRSIDGGDSWLAPLGSPEAGPRYRCLAQRDGRLYACGGGEPNGDAFLLGVSSDDGASWTPLMKLGALAGTEPCAAAACAATADWLCTTYDVCGSTDAGADGGTAPDDAGSSPTGASDGGCGCRIARRDGGAPTGSLVLAVATLAVWRAGRRRARRG